MSIISRPLSGEPSRHTLKVYISQELKRSTQNSAACCTDQHVNLLGVVKTLCRCGLVIITTLAQGMNGLQMCKGQQPRVVTWAGFVSKSIASDQG